MNKNSSDDILQTTNQIKVFGVTGGIACGKSTATKLIARANIPIIDADQVARDVVEPGSYGLKSIELLFGKEVFMDDGSLDRKLLGSIVFNNKDKLIALNKLMSPLIRERVSFLVQKYMLEGVKLLCYDCALIIETGDANKYKPLIVVACSAKTQLNRLMKRNSLEESEALARINAQMKTEEKIKFADYVVDTDGTIEQSEQQITKIIDRIKNEYR